MLKINTVFQWRSKRIGEKRRGELSATGKTICFLLCQISTFLFFFSFFEGEQRLCVYGEEWLKDQGPLRIAKSVATLIFVVSGAAAADQRNHFLV